MLLSGCGGGGNAAGGPAGAGPTSPATYTLSVLSGFSSAYGYPPNSLSMDAHGDLYVTTNAVSPSLPGAIFEIPAGATAPIHIADFPYPPGTSSTVLAIDGKGDLFGAIGGMYQPASVYTVAAGQHSVVDVASIDDAPVDDAGRVEPTSGLAIDAKGDIFGATVVGGANNVGALYEVAAGADTVTTLASFGGDASEFPSTNVVLDAQGDLFGATKLSGANDAGNVYEVLAGSNAIVDIGDFPATVATSGPDLVVDRAGNVYGTMTYFSGIEAVYEVVAGSHQVTQIAQFSSVVGTYGGSLVVDAAGNLYGTALGGGSNDAGTVFEIAAGTGAITDLTDFSGTNLREPDGLVRAADGTLYGSAAVGGSNTTYGAIFKLTIASRSAAPHERPR